MTEKLIEQAIVAHWGERCSEPAEGCAACEAWAEFDALSASVEHAEPVAEALRKRIAKLQRRSFILVPAGNGVRAVKDSIGSWLNFYEVWQLVDDLITAGIEAAPTPPPSPAPELEKRVAELEEALKAIAAFPNPPSVSQARARAALGVQP